MAPYLSMKSILLLLSLKVSRKWHLLMKRGVLVLIAFI